MQKYSSKFKIPALFIIILISTFLFLIWAQQTKKNTVGALDSFAQCLAEKKITMYGADWCPHCQNEKNAFGDSFRFVPYVECPDNPQQCLALEVNGYPTWIFPDGRRLEGEQGLRKLSEASGCALPQ